MLVSFHLASKYPGNLASLFDTLETATDLRCFEVLVKADTEDSETRAFLELESRRRKFRLIPHITPRRRGYEDLWEALNELHRKMDPSAYFVCNINDEVRIQPSGWDERLKRYIGLFPDHIFRLRTSKLKFRNYYDFWECGFAPENYAFCTKRWLDICGGWGPCFGPDSCQQYIAYYLGYSNYPSIKQYNRDVPILDIKWTNEGVGLNLVDQEARRRRTNANLRLWGRQVSHPMQQELYRRARLLQANIIQSAVACSLSLQIIDDINTCTVLLRDSADGALLDLLPYKIGRSRLAIKNLYRYLHYGYFAGGGRPARNVFPISASEFLVLRYSALYHFGSAALRAGTHCLAKIEQCSRLIILGVAHACVRTQLALATMWSWFRCVAIWLARSVSEFSGWMHRRQLGTVVVRTRPYPIRRGFELLTFATSKSLRVLNSAGRAFGSLADVLVGTLSTCLDALRCHSKCVSNRVLRSATIALNPWNWRELGRRTSLALMDRDLRWFTIKSSHRSRLASIHDPWFDPYETKKQDQALDLGSEADQR
jgi:hypothetical protein